MPSQAIRRAHKGRKRNHGGDPTTTSGEGEHVTTIAITMTGTGTRMTMTTDVVSTPTTIAIPPSGSNSDTTFVVIMPTDGSGSEDGSDGSITDGSDPSITDSAAVPTATGSSSNGTAMTMTFGSEVFTFTNGGALPTGLSGSELSSMLAAQTALTAGLSTATDSPASTVTQNVAILTLAAGYPDSAAQARTNGDGDSNGTHTAAIVGATLGAAAFLIGLVAVILAFWAILRKRSKREEEMMAALTANQYAQSRRGSQYPPTEIGN